MIICLGLSLSCTMTGSGLGDDDDLVWEPENNLVSKTHWDLCCRICIRARNLKGVAYIVERDILQCQCSDGIRAEIYIANKNK